jgi:hypothetical protein
MDVISDDVRAPSRILHYTRTFAISGPTVPYHGLIREDFIGDVYISDDWMASI